MHTPSDPDDPRFVEVLDRALPHGRNTAQRGPAAEANAGGRTGPEPEPETAATLFVPFMALSRVLLGGRELALWLGRAYLGTLLDGAENSANDPDFRPHYAVDDIRDTFAVFERIVANHPADLEAEVQREIVAAGNQTSVVAKSMIALWYCAGLIDLTPPARGGMGFLTLTAPIDTYAAAFIWQAIGGNPMGIPGPYYGNWAYPSPTPITAPPPRGRASGRTGSDGGGDPR